VTGIKGGRRKATTRPNPVSVFVAFGLVAIVAATLWQHNSDQAAHAATVKAAPVYSVKQERPVGGCKEAWMAPRSTGADWCRDRGWTVTGHLVSGPHAVLRAFDHLPFCRYEDGSGQAAPCIWFGQDRFNGEGLTYWVDRADRVHYVWPMSPVRYNVGPPIRWATAVPECVRQNHRVACPDGQVIRLR